MDNMPTLDEALAELEKRSIRTSQGTYVKMDDVRKLMDERKTASQIEAKEAPKPKDMNSAKQMILKDEELMKNFPRRDPKLGRSIPATESQTSSRT